MNKTLLVVLVVVLGIGAVFLMKQDKEQPATSAEPEQVAETTEAPVAEETEEVELTETESTTVVTTEAAASASATDVDETLAEFDSLFDETYDDSELDSEFGGNEFDALNNAYEL